MLEVWIVVDGEVNATGELMAASPATATMVEALRKAIAQPATTIKVFGKNHLNSLNLPKEVVFCPLTLHLPSNFDFPEKHLLTSLYWRSNPNNCVTYQFF